MDIISGLNNDPMCTIQTMVLKLWPMILLVEDHFTVLTLPHACPYDAPRGTPGYRIVQRHLASTRSKIMHNNLVHRSKRAYC